MTQPATNSPLLKADAAAIAVKAEPAGKLRVSYQGWDEVKIIFPAKALELSCEPSLRPTEGNAEPATTARLMTSHASKTSPTPAERMRHYRKRRRRGVRVIHLPLHVTAIDALIREKLLKKEDRDDPFELQCAVNMLISRLVEDPA